MALRLKYTENKLKIYNLRNLRNPRAREREKKKSPSSPSSPRGQSSPRGKSSPRGGKTNRPAASRNRTVTIGFKLNCMLFYLSTLAVDLVPSV